MPNEANFSAEGVPAGAANGGAQLALASSASGMAAGFLHTLCGPDHLAVGPVRHSMLILCTR